MKKHITLIKSRAKQAGGLEKAASRIAKAFAKQGAKVSILTTGSGLSLVDSDPAISIHSIKTMKWPAFMRIDQFDRFTKHWLQQNNTDLVFGMDRTRFQTHLRAGNGVHHAYLKSRIATEGRLKYLSCLINPLHRKILSIEAQAFEHPELKKVFTNSHMVKQEILERFSTDPKKIQVFHNGVEWEEMQTDFSLWPEKKMEHLKTFNLNPNAFHFLFIGNGYMRKGLSQLLHGLVCLNRKDIHLSIVGKDKNIDRYKAEALSLGLRTQVTFFGPRTDLRSFYQFADALVIPSFYDPFANVTVEALAMGLFVVSSKSNGGHEILTPQTGKVIEALLAPESIAHALREAMRSPKTLQSAFERRESVSHLDYAIQMNRLIHACYEQ